MREAKRADGMAEHRVWSGRHPEALTLVVIDDKPDFFAAVRSLSIESGLTVVGECSDWRNAISLLRQCRPALAIVDVHFPFLNGIEIIRTMRRENPQIRFIASTGQALDDLFDVAMKNGTSAFVLKSDLIQKFKHVIATVIEGNRYISPGPLDRLMERHFEVFQTAREVHKLSARQRTVVGLIARGFSNKEAAARLSISESTVEKHRSAAMRRLGLQTSADLVRYAVMNGFVDSNSASGGRDRN
jgi:DNA-binding NarL/FixJ family response regulator